jgi:hypothetical protein
MVPYCNCINGKKLLINMKGKKKEKQIWKEQSGACTGTNPVLAGKKKCEDILFYYWACHHRY